MNGEAALLRDAIQLAVAVARSGEAASPPAAAPASLRSVLGFSKLPARALDQIRRVLEADEDFRARVAAQAREADVGRAGWLWLHRPDGWDAEFERLVSEADSRASLDAEIRAERGVQRRLELAESALARAEAAAAAQIDEVLAARADLEAERERRRAAEAARDAATAESERIVDERTATVRQLKRTEELLQRRMVERRELEEKLASLEHALEGAREDLAVRDEPIEPAPATEPDSGMDRDAVSKWVAEAAAAADRLGSALAEVASLVADSDVVEAPSPRPTRPRRQPIPLPGGVMDDSAEAARHLLGVTGALLLVDGYNVSKRVWSELEISEQRQRLAACLDDLSARSGVDVMVVFDGAEVSSVGTAARSMGFQVRFSPPDVEADDVIIGLARDLPPERPIVVASDDRRVRDGVRRHGANVLSTEQLVGLLAQ